MEIPEEWVKIGGRAVPDVHFFDRERAVSLAPDERDFYAACAIAAVAPLIREAALREAAGMVRRNNSEGLYNWQAKTVHDRILALIEGEK